MGLHCLPKYPYSVFQYTKVKSIIKLLQKNQCKKIKKECISLNKINI